MYTTIFKYKNTNFSLLLFHKIRSRTYQLRLGRVRGYEDLESVLIRKTYRVAKKLRP